ncbi:MAG: hypothetical protein ACE10G_05415, partial [Gemmatimonadales bacterium]
MRVDKAMPVHTQSQTLILACLCLIALAGIHCGGGKDRAYSRGSTVVVSHRISDEAALRPGSDSWAKFLVFLSL